MNPYILFTVKGLDGIGIQGETYEFEVSTQEYIEKIEFILDSQDIVGIKVTFDSETIIDENIKDSTYRLVELYLATVIGELNIMVGKYSIKIDSIHNLNCSAEEGLSLANGLAISCSTSLSCRYPLQRYKELFSSLSTDEDIKDKILLFSNIMQIDNIAVRYLMQYELLKSIVPSQKGQKGQKDITDFIRDKFNPTLSSGGVGFHPTRRDGNPFDEDDITYYRNILAHNDSSALPDNYNDIIVKMSMAATQAIFFALRQIQNVPT